MKKYEFTGETKVVSGHTLHRIRRISDGMVGGWIEKEDNLSHLGSCFVFGNAQVYGDAWVFGNAWVYGNAQVFGNATCSHCIHIQQPKYSITVSDTHIAIGCENHTWDHWLLNIDAIGQKHGYTEEEIDEVKLLLSVAKQQIRRRISCE